MLERYGIFVGSALVHVVLVVLLIPQISYQPGDPTPISIDIVFEAPDPPPEPEPPAPPKPVAPEPAAELPRETSATPARPPAPVPKPQPRAIPAAPTESVTLPPPTVGLIPPPRPRRAQPPSPQVRAVRSILCLRLKGIEREQYSCDTPIEDHQNYAAMLPGSEVTGIHDAHVVQLSSTNRRDSYFEQMMDRNSDIPEEILGGFDITIFHESDGRDPNAKRIRNGQRPDWENDLRRDLDKE